MAQESSDSAAKAGAELRRKADCGDSVRHGEQPEAAEGGATEGGRFWVLARVQKALDKSKTFDEFRKNRPLLFLHMFSGEEDQSAASIRAEADEGQEEGLGVELGQPSHL